MAKVLCVHPYDKTTRFLNRIQHHLVNSFPKDVAYFRVQPWELSHTQCLKRIVGGEESFVIFLGHGRSDSLYGAVSDDLRGYSNLDHRYSAGFQNENFITVNNAEIFRGKRVFCFSCNSADKLGRVAVEKGAVSFMGFGDIPTDGEVKNIHGLEMKYFTASFKGELVVILKTCLARSIADNLNFVELRDLIKRKVDAAIYRELLIKKGRKHHVLLARHLAYLTIQFRTFGDVHSRLLS